LQLFTELLESLEKNGFSPEQDERTLEELCGDVSESSLRADLKNSYLSWQKTFEVRGEERQLYGYATPD
jgi:hypothetical protein